MLIPYFYIWDDPSTQTTSIASGLCAGTYQVTVTDTNGCLENASTVLTEPPLLTSNISWTDASCNGGNTGSALVSVAGGAPNYTYLWSSGGNDTLETGMFAGNHSVTVTDSNGCQVIDSVIISEPTAIIAIMDSTNESIAGANDGSASASISGGIPPYVYYWNTGDSSTTIDSLSPGTYTITITDSNACIHTASVIVGSGLSGINNPIDGKRNVSLYPNPAMNIINFEINLNSATAIYIYDVSGKQIVNTEIKGTISKINTADLSEGVYMYRVVDGNGSALVNGKFNIIK